MLNVGEDGIENVVSDIRTAAEVRQTAQDQVPSLGHSQTVGHIRAGHEAGLQDLKMCLLVH